MRPDTRYEHPGAWGDVRCLACSTVIATLQVDQPGLYAFRKVTELTSQERPLETAKLYCNACQAIQPLDIADMEEETEFSEKGISGDIVCLACLSVITNVIVEEPGIYAFTKVADAP
jgi:hypothetical protein